MPRAAPSSTAVLECRPTETLSRLFACYLNPRCLSRSCGPASPPIWRKTGAFPETRVKSGERRTLCWRGMDSNFQYASAVNLVVAPLSRPAAWDGSARPFADRQSRTAQAAQLAGGKWILTFRSGSARPESFVVQASYALSAILGLGSPIESSRRGRNGDQAAFEGFSARRGSAAPALCESRAPSMLRP